MRYLLTLFLFLIALPGFGREALLEEKLTSPYPDRGDSVYINPAPLVVPRDMFPKGQLIRFELSRDKRFRGAGTQRSEPVRWRMYSPHRVLETGRWYWRVCPVDARGRDGKWSRTYTFVIRGDEPQFATPTIEAFLAAIPADGNRLYCFLSDSLPAARARVRQHPEFEEMITDSRDALSLRYNTETRPYTKITRIAADADRLNTAYQMMGLDIYVNRMVENVRRLLAVERDEQVIANDFNAGELVYTLALALDVARDKFTPAEQKAIESLMMDVVWQYYDKRYLGYEETHLFDNHFWQFAIRHFLQGALVGYGHDERATEVLAYLYELWCTRAPSSGFNRDGAWPNGTNYFSANAISLVYLPELLGYITGTDFFAHPWYRNAGLGLVYSKMPDQRSAGWGDGHENSNPKPMRIRSFFADFLARRLGDRYAAWYTAPGNNDRYKRESETRLWRMASGWQRPADTSLPADAPSSLLLSDMGEVIVHTRPGQVEGNLNFNFRSSAFGSGSHTHSNQNAFNLQYSGHPVYYSVGHYMNFKDRHNIMSYRHSRAHNTILVNGLGQAFTTRAYGQITDYGYADGITRLTGDASRAYRGVSEFKMWEENFAKVGLAQTPEYGFGATPLTKFLRHAAVVHDRNVVVLYDELEADSAVTWDWLLHSPVAFDLDPVHGTVNTVSADGRVRAQSRIIASAPYEMRQTEGYLEQPNTAISQRGEDFTPPHNFTAAFGPSKALRVLTVIQVGDGRFTPLAVSEHPDGTYRVGDITIRAELDPARDAAFEVTK